MSIWQPRSLSQLILVSFFAALAPLGVAILFTVHTLGEMADKSREVISVVVEVTRLGQTLQHDALEFERRGRQFLAVADPELGEIFERERGRLTKTILALEEYISTDNSEIKGLLDTVTRLELIPAAVNDAEVTGPPSQEDVDLKFSVISDQTRAINAWLQTYLDQLQKKNRKEVDALIHTLFLQLSMLATATLALLLLFARWINKPVKDLTQEIHNLGTSGLSHPIEISGPRELQTLGSKLEWLRQGLNESEQQKEVFLRHISHELKTPLASLREGTDLLSEQITGHLSQQQLEIVEIVRQNSIALQSLIENLIDYNRLPSQTLNFEQIELEDLWEELLNHYRLSLNKKALQLQQQGSQDTWVADRSKLKTSLDNLLSNAINYTPEGGSIDIEWRAMDDSLIIDVANSGDPIPPKDAELVFEPFFQSVARRTGPIKGSGIGLSVARECIEAQGGSLSLAAHARLPVCFRLICPAH